ncbi:type I-E CRISPR-associated protein Cse1/CasA [Tropicimonas sp. IMCC34043]|uniref:type I-E CRISPR-associated protein Cse1/CasA n=1 Tax=Tropicimonas sp. IMCC34043 TaxID=2248760 RepID=UPI0013003DBE|nr:type I-E CRISPR-associated protein Cse1/CasA [Tropicimonas sp. IMCC34043]
MPLNLISDPWIPVLTRDGHRRIIAPWEIADPDLLRPDWPRADLNLACLELLIGLVFLADPPAHDEDWEDRQAPDPARLRARLSPLAPAFELTGEGPRFLQDLAPLEGAPNPPDMLFIDSAGGNTAKNNADLMVRRGRYPVLDPAMAAMALYTFQAFAPSGGAGNRTSMRGGGPLVTLVAPQQALWPIVWANVPYGRPAGTETLPWMRATVTSEKGQQVFPEQSHPAEAFFGMPRRLRLVETAGAITGVIQRPYGTNYAGWDHPLSPYYRQKVTDEWLPRHPRPGLFGYRHWLGIVAALPNEAEGLRRRAGMVREWENRQSKLQVRLIVGGWAMDNMKPRDFILSTPPFVALDGEATLILSGLVEAADRLSLALRGALKPVLAEGEEREAVREAFYADTQAPFEARVVQLQKGVAASDVARGWLDDMRQVAIPIFEGRALPGLADRDPKVQQQIVQAHRGLLAAFAGHGKVGGDAFEALRLTPAPKQKEEVAE